MSAVASHLSAEPLVVPGVTTDAQPLHRARRSAGPDRLWIADVSQIWAADAWLHFGFVLELDSARCLGFTSHRVLHAGLVVGPLEQAVASRLPRRSANASAAGHIKRHDTPVVLSRRCHAAGIDFPRWAIPSAADRALAERFVAALRAALIDDRDEDTWCSQRTAAAAIRTWIERDYDPALHLRRRRFAPRQRVTA